MAQLQSTSITGSLIVTQGITGSFSGSITNAVSASYAATASYALNAGDSIWTGSAGNIYYNGGNVGIGTASPTEKLDVRGNLYAEGTNNHATFKATGGSYSYLELHDGASSGYLIKNVSAGTGNGALPGALYTYTDNNKAFQHIHAGSPLVTIQSDGNVGIGVTNPAYKLHVENNLNGGLLQTLRNTNTGTAQYIEFKIGTSDSSELRLGSSYNYAASEWNQTWIYAVNRNLALKTSAGFDIRFYAGGTDDSYERMRITNGGNVGIGTTNPTETLSISGTSTSGVGISLANGDGTGGRILADNSSLYFYSNSGTLVYSLKNSKIRLNDGNGGTIGVELGSGGSISQNGNGGGLTFSDTTAYLSNGLVVSAGNVGIGTTSPGYKLDVNGNTNITGNLFFNSNSTLQAARRYVSTANLSSAGYTVIGTVTGDALASSIRISLQGTANSTVINVMADILVNHYEDILITSYAGMYTTLTLRVISNNNEIYSIEATTDSAFACTTYIEIFPLNSETVVFGGSAQTGTSLTHPCVPGMNVSATGGNSGNLTVGGNVGIGTTSPGYKLEVGGTLGVSGNATFNGGNVYINSDYSYIGNNTTDLVSLSGGTMYLPGNGNVGIGTTSPTHKLQVAGPGTFASSTTSINGNVGLYLGIGGSTSNYNGILFQGVSTYDMYFGRAAGAGVDDLVINNGSSELVRFKSTGNVGIGITTPAQKLHVEGITRLGGSTADGALYVYSSNGTLNSLISGPGNTYLNATYGNVGIGITTPGFKLEVNGGATGNNIARFTTGGTGGGTRGLTVYSDNSQVRLQVTDNAGNQGTWAYLNLNPDGGNVGIGTTNPGAELHVQGTSTEQVLISYDSTRRMIMGRTTGYGWISPYTNGVSYDNLVLVRDGGNVGIGTTSPGQKLQVEGSLLVNTGTSAAAYRDIMLGGIGGWSTGESHGIDTVYGSAGSPTTFSRIESHFDGTNGKIRFRNLFRASAPRTDILMTIQGDGNVGIGTDSPASTLHVYNNADIWHTRIGGASGELRIGGQTASGAVIQALEPGGAIRQLYLQRDGGNVGIGTSSPTATLQINGAGGDTAPTLRLISTASDVFNWASSTQHANLTAGETSIHLIGKANSQYNQAYFGYRHVSDGSSSNMVTIGMYASDYLLNILGNGNVGIGVTNPSYKLHVNGNAYINETLYVNQATTIEDTLTVKTATGAYDVAVIDYSGVAGGRIKIYTDGILRSQIGSYYGDDTFFNAGYGGNVGIGTTSPTQKLSVQGNTDLGNSYGSTTSSTHTTRVSGYAMRYDASNRYGNYGVLILNADSGWTASARRFMITNGLNVNKFAIIRSVDSTTDPSFGDGGAISSGTADFVIDSAGHVGIGTTAPSQKFVVSNGSAEVLKVYSTGEVIVGTNYIYAAASGNSFYSEAAANFRGGIRNDVGAYLQIDGGSSGNTYFNGNVGIGTTTPSHNLHLYGAGDRLIKIENTGTYLMYAGLISNEGYIGSTNATPLGFYTNNVNRLYINTSGNIGIGTASPGYKLDVQGSSGNITIYTNGYLSAGGQIISGLGEFASSSSGTDLNFRAGATHLMVLKTTGCVGIGTTAPASMLHIYGSGNTFTRYTNTTSAGHYIDIGANSAGESFVYGYGAYPLLFGTNATERMRITSGGNIGIGISTPTEKFQVAGNIVLGTTANGYQEAGSKYIGLSYPTLGTDGYVGFQFESVNAPVPYNGNYSQNIKFYTHHYATGTGGTPRMTIQYDGNIGVGTVSPAAKLNIVESTSGYDQVAIFTGTGQYGSSIHLNATGTAGSNWRILSTANGSTPGGGHFGLYNDAAGLYRLVINPSGNVGIGTTNPSNGKLQVNGRIYTVGTAGTANAIFQGGQLEFYKDATPTYAASIGLSGPSSGGTNDIVFETYGGTWSERMRIATGGNIGIGTTSPASRLEVGNFLDAFTNSITVSGRYEYVPQFTFKLGQSGTNYDWIGGVISCGDDGNYNGIINFKTANAGRDTPTTKMVIKANGNVGIGTTSPAFPLHVVRSSGDSVIVVDSGAAYNSQFRFQEAGGLTAAITFVSSDDSLRFYNGGDRFTILSNGSVGIGTTSPTQALTIQKSGYPIIDFYDGATGRGDIGYNTGTTSFNVSAYGSTPMAFYSNGLERMRITSGGNVGIGLTTPQKVLDVFGSAGILGSFGASLGIGQFAGIHFGYSESHLNNDSYKKSALVFERTDNNNQGGNASGKIHFLLNNNGSNSATTLSSAVVTIDSDANGTIGSVRMGVGTRNPTATLNVSGSTNVLNVRGSGSAATSSIFSVDGNNGRLFEVSDDLSNSLFSVNTIAGLPVIEAFADYTVTMGTYGAYTLQVTGSRVGVGTSSPGYPLHVSGSVSGISIYATNDIAAFSDQSVKTDLQVIDSAVDRIKQINGYTYVRVDDLSNTRRAGVIAQEVQKVLPEVVSENTDGTLNVAYSNMIALLIEGMKEQQIQIDKLREDLEDLRYEL